MSASIPKLTNPQLMIGAASCFVAALFCGLLSSVQSQDVTSEFRKNQELISGMSSNSPANTDKNIAWNFGALQSAMRIMPGHLTQSNQILLEEANTDSPLI